MGRHEVDVVFVIALAECGIRALAERDVPRTENLLRAAPPMFAMFPVGPMLSWAQLFRAGSAEATVR